MSSPSPPQKTPRWSEEHAFHAVVEATAPTIGKSFFHSLVKHLALALEVRHAFVAEFADSDKRVRTLAFWRGDDWIADIEYDLEGTPCEEVLRGDLCLHPDHVQTLFPGDNFLREIEAVSYLGVPLLSADAKTLGHLAVIDSEPMAEDPCGLSIFRVFADRTRVELERQRVDDALKSTCRRLEVEVQEQALDLSQVNRELVRAYEELARLRDRLAAENVYLQEEIRQEHHFGEIVGNSQSLLDVLAQVETIAPTSSTVLIQGETGTGKELVARAIHDRSTRRERPLVKVNCSAISAGLVESELFGHVKGAFTGAVDRRRGRFELADKGTIFLDEIGDLPQETQVKLLRVLQEREFEPVGSSETRQVDVRIIAATHQDLEKAVAEGRFRSDLYYRLNVLPVRVPALRQRRSDIPLLVRVFLERFAKDLGKKIEGVVPAAMDRLLHYDWPGNVRELQNIVERAVVLTRGPVLSFEGALFPGNGPAAPAAGGSAPTPDAPTRVAVPAEASQGDLPTLVEMERRHILAALERAGGVVGGPNGAARILDLHPNTLRSRMKKLGIERPADD